MKKIFREYSITEILIISFIFRAAGYFYFADEKLVNEWGVILHNYQVSGIYGYYVTITEYFADPKFAVAGEEVLPTIFMPPLYFYFINSIKYLSYNLVNLVDLIIFFQIIISLFSIIIFYKIVKFFEKDKLILLTTSAFAFFPLNVYAALQVSSIVIQIFFLLLFFYFLIKFHENKKLINLINFSIFSGLLILTRGEFILFYVLTLLYFFIFFNKNIKAIFISLVVMILLISPYLYRNYTLFNTLTLTKSFGYNLLKGNNPSLKVEGDSVFINKKFNRKDLKIKTNNRYEINLDDYYKAKAIEFIFNDPIKYSVFYFKKIIAFTFFDLNSTYPHYFNIFHLAPKIILAIFSFFGSFLIFRNKSFYQYLCIFYFCNIFLFSSFFILPRYSLILLPVQILLSINLIKYLRRKFSDKFF
jgi:hypothetical protein